MYDFDVERSEDVDRIVTDVGGDDRVGSTTKGCGYHVAVFGVGECHCVFQVLPTVNTCVLEGVLHVSESLLDLFGRNVGMDLYDGVGCLGEDPAGP